MCVDLAFLFGRFDVPKTHFAFNTLQLLPTAYEGEVTQVIKQQRSVLFTVLLRRHFTCEEHLENEVE